MLRVVLLALAATTLVAVAQSCGGPAQCAGTCGNGICDYPAETCASCAADCGLCPLCDNECGNALCEDDETSCNCRADCGACCVDGVCSADAGETFENCAADCAFTLLGRVVDPETGAGVPGVGAAGTLALWCGASPGSQPLDAPRPMAVDVSRDGDFVVPGLREGDWSCWAELASYERGAASISLRHGEADFNRTLVVPLPRLATGISGEVWSPRGTPVVGARINCTRTAELVDAERADVWRTHTNSHGRFAFEPIVQPLGETGDMYHCGVTADGYAEQVLSAVLQPTRDLHLTFRPSPVETTLTVTVIDKQTELVMVERARVSCHSVSNAAINLGTVSTGDFEAEIGSALFRAVPEAGVYECSVYSDAVEGDCVQVDVHAGKANIVELHVRPRGGHVRGFVIEDNGTPEGSARIARATVTCTNVDPTFTFAGSAQSQSSEKHELSGAFTVAHLPAGVYDCVASAPQLHYQPSPAVRVQIVACDYVDIALFMKEADARVYGNVWEPARYNRVTQRIRQMSGVTVTCTSDKDGVTHSTVSNATANPNYDFGYTVPSGNVQCRCSAPGYVDTVPLPFDIEPDSQRRVDCEMIPILGSITVQMLDGQTDDPLCMAVTWCRSLTDGIEYDERRPRTGNAHSPVVFGQEEAGVDVRYDTYACRANGYPEYGWSDEQIVTVDAVEPNPVIALRLPPVQATMVGAMLDDGALTEPESLFRGMPVVGGTITCDVLSTNGDATLTYTSTVSDADGAYSLDGVMAFARRPEMDCAAETLGGHATCTCHAQGYVDTVATFDFHRGHERQFNCFMTPEPLTLSVNVWPVVNRAELDVDPRAENRFNRGVHVPNATVTCRDTGSVYYEETLTQYPDITPGTFEFRNLRGAQSYQCRASAPGYDWLLGTGGDGFGVPFTPSLGIDYTEVLLLHPRPSLFRGDVVDCADLATPIADAQVRCVVYYQETQEEHPGTWQSLDSTGADGSWASSHKFWYFGETVRCQASKDGFSVPSVLNRTAWFDDTEVDTTYEATLCLYDDAAII